MKTAALAQVPSEHLKPETDQEAARLFRHLSPYADAHLENAKDLQVLGRLEGEPFQIM